MMQASLNDLLQLAQRLKTPATSTVQEIEERPSYEIVLSEFISTLLTQGEGGGFVHRKQVENSNWTRYLFKQQAFLEAWKSFLESQGLGVPDYQEIVHKSHYICRFDNEKPPRRIHYNHVYCYAIQALQTPKRKWVLYQYQPQIQLPPKIPTFFTGSEMAIEPWISDPFCTTAYALSSSELPEWLVWKGNVLSGTPPPRQNDITLSIQATYFNQFNGIVLFMAEVFYLHVPIQLRFSENQNMDMQSMLYEYFDFLVSNPSCIDISGNSVVLTQRAIIGIEKRAVTDLKMRESAFVSLFCTTYENLAPYSLLESLITKSLHISRYNNQGKRHKSSNSCILMRRNQDKTWEQFLPVIVVQQIELHSQLPFRSDLNVYDPQIGLVNDALYQSSHFQIKGSCIEGIPAVLPLSVIITALYSKFGQGCSIFTVDCIIASEITFTESQASQPRAQRRQSHFEFPNF